MNQRQASKILKSGANVFLTGSAGTGKTFLLNKFAAHLKKNKVKVSVTASTGIAATHLEGRTIHSWAGIGIRKEMDDRAIVKLAKIKGLHKRINGTEVLIIDEISMLDADRIDLVDRICREVKDSSLPFGGIQVVMCGDFLQLPPVGRYHELEFTYESSVWRNSDIRICYLDKQFRQSDLRFADILNKIRTNEAGEEELNILKTRLNMPIDCHIKPTQLYTHNVNVDAINDHELSKLSEKEKDYRMTHYGSKNLVNFLKRNCLAPEELKLKIGAITMFVKNNFNAGYANGTLGRVVGYDDSGYPIIRVKSGCEIVALPDSWSIEEDRKVVASIKQVPLRLAWAITVHKSQGMSLDAAEIDLSRSFECGMGYVALSRVRALDSINLVGINEMALKANPEAVKQDRKFREMSE